MTVGDAGRPNMDSAQRQTRSFSVVTIQGIDRVAIRHVAEALKADGLAGCRRPERLHAAKILEWIAEMDFALDGNLGEYCQAVVDIRDGAMAPTGATSIAQSKANQSGFGSEWRDEVQAAINANRTPDGYSRIVDRLVKKHGLTRTKAMQEVASLAGIEFESVKKALQRLKKKRVTY